SVNFPLVVNVPNTVTSGTAITHTVTVSSATTETDSANNTATAVTTALASTPDLTIVKTHSGSTPHQGQTGFHFTLQVATAGGAATSGTVTVSDTLPTGLTATAASGAGWSCSVGATTTCSRSDALAADGVYPNITLTVSIAANAPTSITNTATV